MPVYDYDRGEINIKVVYYGPGLSGKTTNLEHIYSKLPRDSKGKMVSMKTRADRTLFFDFLPVSIGTIRNMRVRFLLYTVPGQVYYNATRKLVLKGVDAIVFVADSQEGAINQNKDSLNNLEENLGDLGMKLNEIPWVVQLNKRDLSNIMDSEEIKKQLGLENIPVFEGIATKGKGVYETFEGIANIVFERISEELEQCSPEKNKRVDREDSMKIDAEVVAQGTKNVDDSEAGEGESLDKAEESEEEHKSVSEFVDDILKESKEDGAMKDLGTTGVGYEKYGHLVDLNYEEGETEEVDEKTEISDQDMQLISDPLEKLAGREDKASSTKVKPEIDTDLRRKEMSNTIRVPVEIPKDHLRGNTPLRVILNIKIVS
jgi:signal recognition particle receptor subunit beta